MSYVHNTEKNNNNCSDKDQFTYLKKFKNNNNIIKYFCIFPCVDLKIIEKCLRLIY